jgi:hypothetical protein
VIGENRDRDIDRPIRYGKGKSRIDQLERKTTTTSKSGGGTLISAKEFTQ